MKKVALFLAGLLLLGGLTANAQSIIVKAGYNYSNLTVDKSTTVSDLKTGRSGWQLGVGYQSESVMGFSFQPELIYKVKGLKLEDAKNLNLGYVEVPFNVQWGPDLLIARPFIFAGPYVGVKVSNQFHGSSWTDTDRETVLNGLKKAEWGLGIGLGVNFLRLQVTGKYNWNFGPVADAKEVPVLGNAPRTFELSLGLKF